MANKDNMRLIRQVRDTEGWAVEERKNRKGHLKIVAPSGNFYFASGTPSDHRAVLNFRAFLRREGMKV